MEMNSIAQSMRARMPWPVGQKVLQELDLPRGRGWEKTLEQLVNPTAHYEDDKVAEAAEALKEHLWCGEKLVRFYETDTASRKALLTALSDTRIPKSKFRDSYPALLDDESLKDESTNPRLIAIEETSHDISAVLASVRPMIVREPLTKDAFPGDAFDLIDGYEEIYGLRHIRHQAVDVISVPKKTGHINVRIDFPEGMHRDVGETAQWQARALLSKIAGTDLLTQHRNLFPLINSMYNAKDEGVVVELAFGTTTASLKHEKMRRRAACLRDEAYHKAGKKALSAPIEPYRLSIVWKRPLDKVESRPELNLHSSALRAGGHTPVLSDAVIRKCLGADDFDFVVEKVEHYIKSHDKAHTSA